MAGAMSEIKLTVVGHVDKSRVLGKHLSLDDEGNVQKAATANLVDGVAHRITLGGKPYSRLAELKESLPAHQALVGGVHADELSDQVPLGTAQNTPVGGIARTKACLPWADGRPGLMTIDCDGGGEGERTPGLQAPQTREELKTLLEGVAPGITEGFVLMESASAGLYNTETGEELKPVNRWHLHVLVLDAAEIPRALEAMHVRLFNAGHGWVLISTVGRILPRSPVDQALRVSCQPIFGSPDLGEGLERRVEPAEVVEGGLYDTRRIKPLTKKERLQYEAELARTRAKVERDQAPLLNRLRDELAKRISKQTGEAVGSVRNTLSKIGQSVAYLTGRLEIHLDNSCRVSVNEILAEPEKYHKAGCHDPMEPELGSGKAIIYTDDAPTPIIHSAAHGLSTTYIIRMDLSGFLKWLGTKTHNEIESIWAREAARILEPGRVAEEALVSGMENILPGLNRSALKAIAQSARVEEKERLEKARLEEEAAEVKRRTETDGMLFLVWRPVDSIVSIEAVQKHLGSRKGDPLMQHSDSLVVVREAPPTYVDVEDVDPPLISRFKRLNFENTRQLIEENTVVLHKGKKVPVPASLVKGVLEPHTRLVPPVSGVVDHPIALGNGRIICTEGLDEETQIFMASTVEGVIPSSFSQREAVKALAWLKEVFMEGFPFASPEDADYAVAILLTGMQRAVLDEAPGGIVDGSNRAVGKTTLLQIIFAALMGRYIPAISLPEAEEEIEKRLVAVLLEGRDVALFDNVREGRELKSEALAACATSSGGFSGRILGESRTMESTGRMMPVLTGVNVRTKGDFNTRFITVRLESDEPNPEKKRYKRGNLKGWVLAHRSEILRCCLAIVAGYQKAGRPDVGVEGDIRFKQWDYQVRRPIVWAGGCDVAQTFEKNKEMDVDHTARAAFLAALWEWQEARPEEKRETAWTAAEVCVSGSIVNGNVIEAYNEIHPKLDMNSRNLGNQLRVLKDMNLDGLVVRSKEKKKNRAHWLVEKP